MFDTDTPGQEEQGQETQGENPSAPEQQEIQAGSGQGEQGQAGQGPELHDINCQGCWDGVERRLSKKERRRMRKLSRHSVQQFGVSEASDQEEPGQEQIPEAEEQQEVQGPTAQEQEPVAEEQQGVPAVTDQQGQSQEQAPVADESQEGEVLENQPQDAEPEVGSGHSYSKNARRGSKGKKARISLREPQAEPAEVISSEAEAPDAQSDAQMEREVEEEIEKADETKGMEETTKTSKAAGLASMSFVVGSFFGKIKKLTKEKGS